jgi:hypothetical protein
MLYVLVQILFFKSRIAVNRFFVVFLSSSITIWGVGSKKFRKKREIFVDLGGGMFYEEIKYSGRRLMGSRIMVSIS